MNILWVNHEYPPVGGGGATATKALAREFAALGHSVTVVTAAYKDAYTETPAFETVSGVDIHRLKCKRSAKDQSSFAEMLSFLLAAFRFVPELAKKQKFDITYIFFGIPNGPIGWYLYKRFKIPYIVCLGGGDVPGTQKRFAFVYALLSPFLKAIWRNAVYVAANSHKLRERAERYYNKARFTVVFMGANLSIFPAEKIYKKEGIFNIVTTARIVERKGIQHVIQALPRLVEATDGNIHYTVIGDGPYRNQIESLAEKLGVTKHLTITGMLPYDEYLKRLVDADAFVLASHWEGMPCAATEAMAAHLPVIMSSCEGSADLIDGNGFIIESGEALTDMLAEKILALYNDKALAAKMGECSYERVNKYFRWDENAKKLLELGLNWELGIR